VPVDSTILELADGFHTVGTYPITALIRHNLIFGPSLGCDRVVKLSSALVTRFLLAANRT